MSKGKEERRRRALERDAERRGRTPEQQLAVLDERLGPGVGAERERARLTALIDNAANQKGESS